MAEKKPMKGYAPDPKWPMKFPCYVSIKYDGIRCLMDGMNPRTASMKHVANTHVNRLLMACPDMHDLDMELGVGEPSDPLFYSDTFSGVMSQDAVADVKFYIFDVCDTTKPFWQRQLDLQARNLP